ncbi:MAG: substrate-binding domain-containing protein [Blautia wexlerae]
MARYDNLAAVALSVAGRTGRKVPDDLMVTGFDNDFISNYVSPALTTVGDTERRSGKICNGSTSVTDPS